MVETTTRRQGPKRSEASRAAILVATREELAENGWRKFSVDNVARRARASKQTIYRWWPSIGAMCLEAGLALLPPLQSRGRDPQERIADLLRPVEAAARIGTGHAVLRAAVIAASDDPGAGEAWRGWINSSLRSPLRIIMAELAAKRVIRQDWDIDSAVEALVGPLWHRMVIMRAPIPEGFAMDTAARVLAAATAR